MATIIMQNTTKTYGSYHFRSATPNVRDVDSDGFDTNTKRRTEQEKPVYRTSHRDSASRGTSISSTNKPKVPGNIYSRAIRDPFSEKARLESNNVAERNSARLSGSKSPIDRRFSHGVLENHQPAQADSKMSQAYQQQAFTSKTDSKQTNKPSQIYYSGLNRQNMATLQDKAGNSTAEKLEKLPIEEPRPYIIKQNTPPKLYKGSLRAEMDQYTPEYKQLPTEPSKATNYLQQYVYEKDKILKYQPYSYNKMSEYLETTTNQAPSKRISASSNELDQDIPKYAQTYSDFSKLRVQTYQKLSQQYPNSQTIINSYPKANEGSKTQTNSVNQTPTNRTYSQNLNFNREVYGHDEGVLSYSKNIDSGIISTSKNNQITPTRPEESNSSPRGVKKPGYIATSGNSPYTPTTSTHQYPGKVQEPREYRYSDYYYDNYPKLPYGQKYAKPRVSAVVYTKQSSQRQDEAESLKIPVSQYLSNQQATLKTEPNSGQNQQASQKHHHNLPKEESTPQEHLFQDNCDYITEIQNTGDEGDSNLNYSNITTPIRAITLQSEQTKTRYFQNPFTQNPPPSSLKQNASTQASSDNDKQVEKTSDNNQRESFRTGNLHALFEEYRNSVTHSKRSRSEAPSRRETPRKEKKPKVFLSNLKDIPSSIVKSTKNYFVNKLSLSDARVKCSCSSDLGKDETCDQAMKWLLSRYKLSELDYLKTTYEKLQTDAEIDSKSQKQITLDVSRTFPGSKYFKREGGGLVELQRLLECFAKYDPQIGKNSFKYMLILIINTILIGYVQGMNFIAASFLYHAEEYIAFWLLVMMFELFEMRDIYAKSNNHSLWSS